MRMDLVPLATFIPQAIVDMRYASERNIIGRSLTANAAPLLDRQAAAALQQVEAAVVGQQLRLVLWDAYRTSEVQRLLRNMLPDDKYVLEESNHLRGLAVDITLAYADGTLLDMGTDHDDFSEKAHSDNRLISKEQQANRQLLADAMSAQGFKQWPYEWWHFDFMSGSKSLLDQ